MLVAILCLASRRRQTRCALVTGVQTCALPICSVLAVALTIHLVMDKPPLRVRALGQFLAPRYGGHTGSRDLQQSHLPHQPDEGVVLVGGSGDRKRVVWGKCVSVRVDLGGGRIIKKRNETLQ